MSLALTILGCSSALPTSKRFPTAQVLNISGQFFLIDCGEGTQIQVRKYKIRINKINQIFISHCHGDHFFGLFGLISTMNLLGRKGDLAIFAPVELKKILDEILKNYGNLNFKIVFHPVDCSKYAVIYENNRVTVESIPLRHRIPTSGFLFREKPGLFNINKEAIGKYQLTIKEIRAAKEGNDITREDGTFIPFSDVTLPRAETVSYVYCSDTLYNEDMIPFIENVDLLYHEATYMENMKDRAIETFHSTALQAAEIALKARVKRLVIGHYSARYTNLNDILEEARGVFPDTDAAEDGKTFILSP